MVEYNQVTSEIVGELNKISGSRVLVGEDVNPDYPKDMMPIYGTRMSDVSIDMASTEETADLVKVCYHNGIPVTVRGPSTGLVGSCTPICGGGVLFSVLLG